MTGDSALKLKIENNGELIWYVVLIFIYFSLRRRKSQKIAENRRKLFPGVKQARV